MENFGILSVLHYLCRRKLTEMKQITLIIACVWMTLATYAQRTIIVEKGNVQSLLAAISEANHLNADSTAERLFILIPMLKSTPKIPVSFIRNCDFSSHS